MRIRFGRYLRSKTDKFGDLDIERRRRECPL